MTEQEILEQILDAEDKVTEPNIMDSSGRLLLEEVVSSKSVGKKVRTIHDFYYGDKVIHTGFHLIVENI
jgi:hypothetical protein